MPEQIRCPSCNAALRVPETLLGKNVKCPKCQTTFLAEMEELAYPQGVALEPTPEAQSSRLPTEDADEEFPPEEEEERSHRGRRRHRGSARALDAVSGPAVAMMIATGLGLFSNLAYLVFRIIVLVTIDRQMIQSGQYPGMPRGFAQANTIFTASVAGALVTATLGAFLCLLALIGAIRMKQLKSYGLAITAGILSLLPFNCCCFLGLPFGIWALVVLNKPEVKEAFS